MSTTLLRDAANRPVVSIIAGHPAPTARGPRVPGSQSVGIAPREPTPGVPDDRTRATWRLSWGRIRNRQARDAVAAAIDALDGDDVQTHALLEQADERLQRRGRALAREYRRASESA